MQVCGLASRWKPDSKLTSVRLKPEMICGSLSSGARTADFTNQGVYCHTGLSVSAQVKDRLKSDGALGFTDGDRESHSKLGESLGRKGITKDRWTDSLS
ncbi:hypothetical protein Spb1_02790 [Planctopirus ephydatiae]|uniref:Uncharacterized protein n=1 Tax=Planctopirus ephydatiae TaxID=2528019 RepID=A0A518GIK5_9PLAN|nr:hypothetical protein Spb1_02790 [Planctopirus ephydatiae]